MKGRLPCGHPVFAWLVQHSSSVLTKSLVGKDGRTPYGRLFGKEVAEEGLEFGERLRWKLPRLMGHNTLLEARWHEGVWLGRLWASPVHYVYDAAEKCVREVRAVQRVPLVERWSREAVEAVDVWPRRLEPAQEVPEARAIPEAAPPEGAHAPDEPRPAERRGPNPVYIQKSDLVRYGYSEGCVKCDRLRAGRPAGGFRHSEACRRRIERELREAGDRRIEAAERRLAERVIEAGGDPSVPAGPEVAEEGRPAAAAPAAPPCSRVSWARKLMLPFPFRRCPPRRMRRWRSVRRIPAWALREAWWGRCSAWCDPCPRSSQ